MTLPDEQALTYPADWEDEDRMHFLLGPFPTSAASSTLPLDDQKVQFWSSLIHCVSRATRRPVFSGREMAERLQWRGQTPSCLQQVLVVMRKSGQLCLMQDLLEGAKGKGWLSWGARVLSGPLRWVWQKYQPQDYTDAVYVDTQLLKDAAELVLHKLQVAVEYRNTDQVVTGEKLKYVSLEVVDASAVEAVELELVRQGKVKCTMSGGQKVIKFCVTGDQLPVDVSDIDLHILSLKETIGVLQRHISSLTDRIARVKIEARELLQQKQRQLALSCLRRGHGAQHTLATKAAMLANLQDILHQIQMAETNCLVLEVYRKGADVLKGVNDGMLMAAEETVDELHEVMQESEEIGAVLGGTVENEELERELEALLSGADSGTEANEDHMLAEQLSKLELISPPDKHPMKPMKNVVKKPIAAALH